MRNSARKENKRGKRLERNDEQTKKARIRITPRFDKKKIMKIKTG